MKNTKDLYGIVLGLAGFAMADDGSTAYIDLSTTRGESSQNASGFIYGMPLSYDPNDIPDQL